MSERWEDRDQRRRHRDRHRRHRRHRRDSVVEVEEELDESLLSPEERARREADRKVELTGDLLKFGIISALLLIFLPPVGIIFLIFCGAKNFRRFYALVLEPRMRERYLREEVEKQVHAELSRERQLMEGEHARSMQELSASIAHEIRNPITAAKSLVQQMEEDPGAKENLEYARVALEELSRVERSVSHLLRFARDEEVRVSTVCMADVIDSALETFRDRLERSGIELERRIDSDGAVVGDAEKLRRVVINLVGNAIDAIDEGHVENGRVEVQLGENLAGSEVWLRVSDNGPGVDELAVQKMFSPFYTSKDGGTGLGLPICKKLVDAHGGTIELDATSGSGAAFVVTLPKAVEGDAS
jgi:signal transduction histidine kinase